MRMNTVVVQLALFALVAVVCTSYVGFRVLGGNPFAASYRVTVRADDAHGLIPSSEVTYRGVSVGRVESVELDQDTTGVQLELSIEGEYRIPANAKAAVAMDSAVPIQHLDLRPDREAPPYLADGSVIDKDATSGPLPLETLLVHFTQVADSLDPDDLVTVSTELAAGLGGLAPELRQTMDNGITLLESLRDNQDALTELLTDTRGLVRDHQAALDALPDLTAQIHQVTSELAAAAPDLATMIDNGTPLANTVLPLLTGSQQSFAVLMANLASTMQVVETRVPALDAMFVALPTGLQQFADIEHDGVAAYELVAAQGPVCYYPNERRSPTDTAPREPVRGFQCPSGPGLQQRGAVNAPRPAAVVSSYDPATGATVGPDGQPISFGANGGQDTVLGPRSWYALLLQGVS